VSVAPDLPETVRDADARLDRLLRDIDAHIDGAGLDAVANDPTERLPVVVPAYPETLDLRGAGIHAVVWATGHRRAYPWLDIPLLDAHGEIRQRHGITPVPGLFVLGYRFQCYRSSNWICGVGRDAAAITEHIIRAGVP
jgi:putative flavoprotein involved in K+ transport